MVIAHDCGRSNGAVLKAARIALGLTVTEAGSRCGFSGSTVSRWENGKRTWSLDDLTRVAAALGVPGYLVGLAENSDGIPGMPMTASGDVLDDGSMRRRQLLQGSLAVLSAATLGPSSSASSLERVLYTAPGTESVPLRILSSRLSAADQALRDARLSQLRRNLPSLLAAAQSTYVQTDGAEQAARALILSRVYAVAAQVLLRTSRDPAAAVAADRAGRYAELAHDPTAIAEAAKLNAVMLRRARSADALNLMIEAAEQLAGTTGLNGYASGGTYMRIMATAAYTAAQFDQRNDVSHCLTEAGRVYERCGDTSIMTGADLAVFRVSVDRVLGDYGAALHHAHHVDLSQVPTAHERARYWQDVAISAHARKQTDTSLTAIAEIETIAPQYLRHRPWAHDLVNDLTQTRTGGASPMLHRIANQIAIAD